MHESPIRSIESEMKMQLEGEILKAVQNVGVDVDKEELLRALAYDRGQYDKGYKDGVREVCEKIVEQLESCQEMAYEVKNQINDLYMERRICKEEYCKGRIQAYQRAIEIIKEEME